MPELIADLREAARTLVREFRVVDGSGCIPGISVPECHLLMELDMRGVATATELGEILLMEKSSLSRIIARLTKTGLIDSDTAATDRRQRHLKLTREGRERVREVHDRADDQVRRALSFVAEPDRSGVLEGLQRYAKALRYARLSDEYHIRPMKKEDNPAVARIIRDVMTEHGAVGCGYSIGDAEVSDMFSAYQGSGAAYFVVVDGHETVLGGAGVGPLDDAPEDTCELKKMYFRPELRGAGMGLQTLRHCLHTARLLGYAQCYLETLDSMHQARHLYRKLGFSDLKAPVGNTGHHACNRWMMREL